MEGDTGTTVTTANILEGQKEPLLPGAPSAAVSHKECQVPSARAYELFLATLWVGSGKPGTCIKV